MLNLTVIFVDVYRKLFHGSADHVETGTFSSYFSCDGCGGGGYCYMKPLGCLVAS